jgi:hypothetical protein
MHLHDVGADVWHGSSPLAAFLWRRSRSSSAILATRAEAALLAGTLLTRCFAGGAILTRTILTWPLIPRPVVARTIHVRSFLARTLVTGTIGTWALFTRTLVTRPLVSRLFVARTLVSRAIFATLVAERPSSLAGTIVAWTSLTRTTFSLRPIATRTVALRTLAVRTVAVRSVAARAVSLRTVSRRTTLAGSAGTSTPIAVAIAARPVAAGTVVRSAAALRPAAVIPRSLVARSLFPRPVVPRSVVARSVVATTVIAPLAATLRSVSRGTAPFRSAAVGTCTISARGSRASLASLVAAPSTALPIAATIASAIAASSATTPIVATTARAGTLELRSGRRRRLRRKLSAKEPSDAEHRDLLRPELAPLSGGHHVLVDERDAAATHLEHLASERLEGDEEVVRRVVEHRDVDPHRVDVAPAHRDLDGDQIVVADRLDAAAQLLDVGVGEHLVDLDPVLLLQLGVMQMLRRARARIAADDDESREALREPAERERPRALGIEDLVEDRIPLLTDHAARLVEDHVGHLPRKLHRRLVDRDALLAEIHLVHRRHHDLAADTHAAGFDEALRERGREITGPGEELRQWYAREGGREVNARSLLLGTIALLEPVARGTAAHRGASHHAAGSAVVAVAAIVAAIVAAVVAAAVVHAHRSWCALLAFPILGAVGRAAREHRIALLHCQGVPM